MVIYNHKKEFVGIEQKDLKSLQLSNLAELKREAVDFSDLFVKTPGFIHNFKHVHWIDFISSSDSIDENRVIISVKGKNYRGTVELQTVYLVDAPSQPAYGVSIQGLRELTKEENEKISGDLSLRAYNDTTEITTPELTPEVQEPQEEAPTVVQDPYEAAEEKSESVALDLGEDLFEEAEEQSQPQDEEKPLELDLDDELFIEEDKPQQPVKVEPTQAQQHNQKIEQLLEDDPYRDYQYDPEVASNELGLPIDLVEEFIQDFIAQANEFKEELYQSLEEGRMDTLRMTSHKLKGVAANLRIEDAYEALVVINTSDDVTKVKETLDKFYLVIMKKLEGKEIVVEEEPLDLPLDVEVDEQESSLDVNNDKLDIKLDIEDDVALEDDKLEIDLEIEDDVALEDEKLDIDLDIEEDVALNEEVQQEFKSKEAQPQAKADLTQEVVLNKEQVIAEMGINEDAYSVLLKDYTADLSLGVEQLQECVQAGDSECIKKLSLRLKGMSDNMRIAEISQQFEEILSNQGADNSAILTDIVKKLNSIERIV